MTKAEELVLQFVLSLHVHCPQVPGMGKNHTVLRGGAEILAHVAVLNSLSHATICGECGSQMSQCYGVGVGGEGWHPANGGVWLPSRGLSWLRGWGAQRGVVIQ